MAIFKCNNCNHIQETSNAHIGKTAKCPKCQEATRIYDTVNYLKKIIEKYLILEKQLNDLQNHSSNSEDLIEIYDPIKTNNINDIDIHNTDLFSKEEHYQPIIKWFKNRYIETSIDPSMMDTTGFFDEIAIEIGNNFQVIEPIVKQIKYIQSKEYDTVKIYLSKNNNNEIKQITSFCKILYTYSFIARYNYQKKNQVIYLTLQEIPKIKSFFNGLWMEWYVLIKLLNLFEEQNITPPIARDINITFSNKEKNELDLFFLTTTQKPVIIECKTGEFRQDLNKYFSLRKKLNIPKENFILCVFGLSDEQTIGLTSMYDITITNESTIINHIKTIL